MYIHLYSGVVTKVSRIFVIVFCVKNATCFLIKKKRNIYTLIMTVAFII